MTLWEHPNYDIINISMSTLLYNIYNNNNNTHINVTLKVEHEN